MLNIREKKEKRKTEIISASISVFASKGYHDASIFDIIQKAKIARGTFYLYFKSKRDIFDSIIDDLLTDLDESIRKIDIYDTNRGPVEQLKMNLRRVFELLHANAGLREIWLHRAWSLDKECVQKLTDFNSQVTDQIESALKQGMSIGIVRKCNTKIIASGIIGLIKEVSGSMKQHNEISIDELIDEIVDFGLNGLSPN